MGSVRRMMRAGSSCQGGVGRGPGRGVGRLGAGCGVVVGCGGAALGWVGLLLYVFYWQEVIYYWVVDFSRQSD